MFRSACRWILAIVSCVLILPAVAAQAERYELGERLKRFEAAWETQKSPEKRKQALKDLPKLTQLFFSFRFGEAGRTLDEARRILQPDSPGTSWLDSLSVIPESRIVDASRKSLKVEVKRFYDKGQPIPPDARLSLRINAGSVTVPLTKLPVTVEVPLLPESMPHDDFLKWQSTAEPANSARQGPTISLLSDLERHKRDWTKLSSAKIEAERSKVGIEIATLIDRAELLLEIAEGAQLETNYPAAKLTAEMAQLSQMALVGIPYFSAERLGTQRISIPTARNRRSPCQLLVPRAAKPAQPMPLVIALHGAGGSENLFFEGYGAGQIVKECEQRGWFLLAPRSSLDFGSGPPIDILIEKLAERYPIDRKKVFLVGHSMGAAQAIALAQKHPTLVQGVAALGGSGRVTESKVFEGLPVYIGVGDQDFARNGAVALSKSLKDSGAKSVITKIYPDLEHLVIVREALPDVFAMFDRWVRGH